MKPRRLAIALVMTLRQLLRNRVALVLLVVVPIAFQAVTLETAPRRDVIVELASVPEAEMAMAPPTYFPKRHVRPEDRRAVVEEPARSVTLIFVTVATVGMLAAYVALTLMQRNASSTLRLVLCGYRPWELLAANVVAFLCVVAALSGVAAGFLLHVIGGGRPAVMLLGLLLAGWVYGCYGLLVGAALRTELAGLLCVVLLSSLDVMWLQNPMDYAEAGARLLIRSLPGHLPSQVSLVGAFEDYEFGRQALGALAYGGALLAMAAVVFAWKGRVRRDPSAPPSPPGRRGKPAFGSPGGGGPARSVVP